MKRLYTTVLSKKSILLLIVTCLLLIMCWLASGSVFNYSDKWQIFTNTGIAVVTFTLVWVVQLARSRKIVEEHNGRLWFESREGKGSTFYVELPLAG